MFPFTVSSPWMASTCRRFSRICRNDFPACRWFLWIRSNDFPPRLEASYEFFATIFQRDEDVYEFLATIFQRVVAFYEFFVTILQRVEDVYEFVATIFQRVEDIYEFVVNNFPRTMYSKIFQTSTKFHKTVARRVGRSNLVRFYGSSLIAIGASSYFRLRDWFRTLSTHKSEYFA